ncbi:MAG: hypothetical protein ABIQ93_00660 [Saprospiraceae bacterium]
MKHLFTFRSIEIPNAGALFFSVSAVETDFGHFTTLASQRSEAVSGFNIPTGVKATLPLRVILDQNNQGVYYRRDKIFQPGEALKIEAPDMQINAPTLSSTDELSIATAGEIDLLTANFSLLDPFGYLTQQWFMQGEPTALQHAVLPDLSLFVPDYFFLRNASVHKDVTAYQYDRLDYRELCAGLPYKGQGKKFFPEANYGLKKISKNF